MNIGKAAELSGISAKMIRYYEGVGLIRPAGRTAGGYRDYDDRDVAVLKFVQRARALGFSVKHIADLLALWQSRSRTSAEVKAIAADHIAEIDRKIKELQSMKATLSKLVACCHGDERPDCPILDDLASEHVAPDDREPAAAGLPAARVTPADAPDIPLR